MATQTSCALDCSRTLRLIVLAVIGLLSAHAGTSRLSRQTWDTESGLPQNTVQSILQSSDGFLWFATEGGLARFDTDRFTVFNTRNTPQFHSNDIRALLNDGQGTLWIATAGGMLARNGHEFAGYTVREGLPSNVVTALYPSGSRVCAVTAAGNACYDGKRFVADGSKPAPERAIDPALRDLVASAILCTYKDREGNIWLGTESSGVTILRNLHFEAFSGRAEGLDGQVRCVLYRRNGEIWFGTDAQGLTRYVNGRFSRLTVSDGLSSNVIVSLGEDAAGDLLIGTPDGLNRLHNGAISLTTSSEGLPDDFIRSIYSEPDGDVWLGTRRGLAHLHKGAFRTFTHADGLGSDLIGSITRDGAGTLWVATLNGLSRLQGERFQNFTTTTNGLSSNVITALFAAGDGLWIGTQGGGLNRYRDGAFTHIALAQMPEVIYGIIQDAQHHTWLASDSGVFRLNASEVIGYGVSDGLRVSECSGGGHPGLARTPDGGIWFATLRGAALLSPDVPLNSVPPPVVVEEVTVDNTVHSAPAFLSVPPGATRVVFNYAAISAAAPQKVAFRYRLLGFDKSWIDAGAARSASYTNLGPGSYSFRVMARNGDGVWNSQSASLDIRLLPRFYQTWWFAAAMALLAALAGFGVYRWRVRRVEAQLESRFEAVLSERNRIAREIHDTLAQGFAGVSVQLEIVSRKLNASGEAAREHLDQARMLVRSSLAEARRSIWELRSQSSEIQDLAARLSQMAAQMGGAGRPRISVDIHGTFRPLEARTEDELLRIAQEAATNAIRHAEATEIRIALSFAPKLVSMTIADDGKGFPAKIDSGGVNGHFGLKGMHERAAVMNAKLTVESAPGAGSKISLEVPV